MKRWLIRIAIFLILGAMINVAVAWGCVCWSTRSCPEEHVIGPWPMPVPDGWPKPTHRYEIRGFGFIEIDSSGDPPIDSDQSIRGTEHWYMASGWPLKSLFLEQHGLEFPGFYSPLSLNWWFTGPDLWRDGLRVPWLLRPQYPLLPTRILWMNLIVNSILWGSLLLGMKFAINAFRLQRRIRSGLCPACAYPAGTSPVCTECGKPLPTKLLHVP